MAWGAVGCILLGLLAWCFWWTRARPGRSTEGKRQLRRRGPAEEEHKAVGVPLGEERGSPVGGCRLICKPSALAQALVKTFCRSAHLETKQWSWKLWPNLQTAIQLLWPPDRPLEFSRDHLQLLDDGIVALDWVVGPADGGRKGPNGAVLLVVPNATGTITRNVQQLCRLALQQGYYPVIFNRRGHNGCPLTTPKLQPFGHPGDLKEAVAYIRFRHPSRTLFAASEGSGSGLLLSYLGECGSSSYLRGAACISPILKAQGWFEAGLPWLYEWSLLLTQKRSLSRYAKALEKVVEVDRVLGSSSLRAFEAALFCPQQQMSWETYWASNDPLRDVDEVAVPVLCLCSTDDPVRGSPEDTIPWELFHSNPFFFLLLSPHGGHCGFLGEGPRGSSWGNAVVLEYLQSLAEFLRGEERTKEKPCRRTSTAQRHGPLRNRGANLPGLDLFSWQRSYTR